MEEDVPAAPNGDLDHRHSEDATERTSDIVYRNRHRLFNMWRPSTYLNAVVHNKQRRNRSFAFSESSAGSVCNSEKESSADLIRELGKRLRWNTLVTVMVVQAKGLPHASDKNSMYCKIRLGTEIYKTKSVTGIPQPEWKEQFQLHIYRDHLLKVSLWDKDKQKTFMGSCVVDLAKLDKERTHELRLDLDDGFGEVHLCVTMCTIRDYPPTPTEETNNGYFSLKKKSIDLKLVGQLQVTAVAARGLSSKPSAYCTLQLHNQRVQTHSISSSNDPVWHKRYIFDVHDITSTLDVSIKDSSIKSSFRYEHLGKVSIPLFRIVNGELRWFALKDKNKRHSAKGNHPRVLLQMSIVWNPVKAALRLFTPKEVKYIEKPRKFDLDVVYKNVIVIQDLFDTLHAANDGYMLVPLFSKLQLDDGNHEELRELLKYIRHAYSNFVALRLVAVLLMDRQHVDHAGLTPGVYFRSKEHKRLFEWDNQELSLLMLIGWLVFWFYFKAWTLPLLLLSPFVFHLIIGRSFGENVLETGYRTSDDANLLNTSERHGLNLKGKIKTLPDVSMNIIANIELVVSLAERLYNLATFKVPFLSYVTMVLLLGASLAIYFIPFNYMMMGFGLYKFSRKHLNPNRTLNNDLVDFLSRIPDNEIWKDWKELSVPEPAQRSGERDKLAGTASASTSAPGPVALLADPPQHFLNTNVT